MVKVIAKAYLAFSLSKVVMAKVIEDYESSVPVRVFGQIWK